VGQVVQYGLDVVRRQQQVRTRVGKHGALTVWVNDCND
jgi:hypothetical protein